MITRILVPTENPSKSELSTSCQARTKTGQLESFQGK